MKWAKHLLETLFYLKEMKTKLPFESEIWFERANQTIINYLPKTFW